MTLDFLLPDELSTRHGQEILRQAKVGAIALAGGHGSRLGYDAPKGCFPLTVVHKKSLFQLLAEKTQAASRRSSHMLPLAIMTSDATHEMTVNHFETRDYFGLQKEQLTFFKQKNLPVRDIHGKILFDSAGKQVTAPDGNGSLFWHFEQSGALALWERSGITHIVVFPIDNALADPFPAHLIGLHDLHHNDVTLIGVKRASADEQVGVVVTKEAKVAVVEYSEMNDSERYAKDAIANISYFAFSMPYIKKVLLHPLTDLPLHQARKKIPQQGMEEFFIKSEYFIFDLLAFSDKTEVLLLPREDCFAPLKNKTGSDSIASVQQALVAFDRRTYHAQTGSWPAQDTPFEL